MTHPHRRRRSRLRRVSAQVAGVNAALTILLVVVNLGAAAVAVVLCLFVIPGADTPSGENPLVPNVVILGAFLLLMVVLVIAWAWRSTRTGWRWLREGREPTARERRRVLRAPLLVTRLIGSFWLAALVVFAGYNSHYSARYGFAVGLTVLLTGLTMCALGYLLSERLMRASAGHALSSGSTEGSVLLGVTPRQLFGWTSATGSAVLGVVVVGLVQLIDDDADAQQLAVAMVVLGSIALIMGFTAELIAARAVAVPLRGLRKAVDRVRRGDLDTRIRVNDGTDVGLLQDGFNRMVDGLRERERVRDLFGRHVGEEVARSALENDLTLGGEVRDVCALFVDLVGSTELAASRPPTEVVDLLNRFFSVVVEAVEEEGGWVNKFEGDAALVVFGAPAPHPHAADGALRAARTLARRLADEVPEVRAGIGVSGGEAVAGNIGAERRFEYTVIGDPVNEAARLTEVAKHVPGLLAASGRLVEAASADEAAAWRRHGEELLRGRAEETTIMVAADAPDAA